MWAPYCRAMIVTRFAPSPTGLLHVGSAYAALFAARAAEPAGRFLVRIEDIDQGRCRPEFETAIYEDLAWLGLTWETPVRRQSAHYDDYAAALAALEARGLLYPCFCTRAEIAREIANAPSAPQGPDGPVYPGTCRSLPVQERTRQLDAGAPHTMRLDLERALATVDRPLRFEDADRGMVDAEPQRFGDIVVGRRDMPTSYHLSVTYDDALQGITLVTRADDLFASTHIHCLLQSLLDLPTPRYRHHRMLTDETGRPLSKRHGDITVRALREAGKTPAEAIALIEGWGK